MKLFRSIADKLRPQKLGAHLFTAEFTIFHDEKPVTRFEMNVKANSKDHAERILERYVEIKRTKLTRV